MEPTSASAVGRIFLRLHLKQTRGVAPTKWPQIIRLVRFKIGPNGPIEGVTFECVTVTEGSGFSSRLSCDNGEVLWGQTVSRYLQLYCCSWGLG